MGHFEQEHQRRRAALRARMPDTAQAIDAFRAAFGPAVDCTGATEGDQTYRDPQAFARAWEACGNTHELIERAKLTVPRGDKSMGMVGVPGDHKRKPRL